MKHPLGVVAKVGAVPGKKRWQDNLIETNDNILLAGCFHGSLQTLCESVGIERASLGTQLRASIRGSVRMTIDKNASLWRCDRDNRYRDDAITVGDRLATSSGLS
jgi:hypothetical protein